MKNMFPCSHGYCFSRRIMIWTRDEKVDHGDFFSHWYINCQLYYMYNNNLTIKYENLFVQFFLTLFHLIVVTILYIWWPICFSFFLMTTKQFLIGLSKNKNAYMNAWMYECMKHISITRLPYVVIVILQYIRKFSLSLSLSHSITLVVRIVVLIVVLFYFFNYYYDLHKL